jgi:TetR/AcrR family transcriptional regulator, transcriptional repressor of bet genes
MPGPKAPEEQRRESILRAAFVVAARERLGGVTVRAVAEQARVSTGLVFFYFESKDALLEALLGWILQHTLVAGELPSVVRFSGSPAERMLAVLRRDVERLPRQRERVELFFDYWVLGTRQPAIRRMIRAALDRYRDAFVPLARDIVAASPQFWGSVTAEALATVAASFVEGCALRVVLDPDTFDVDTYMATLATLVASPARVTAGVLRSPGVAMPA